MTSEQSCRPRADCSLIGPYGQRSSHFFFARLDLTFHGPDLVRERPSRKKKKKKLKFLWLPQPRCGCPSSPFPLDPIVLPGLWLVAGQGGGVCIGGGGRSGVEEGWGRGGAGRRIVRVIARLLLFKVDFIFLTLNHIFNP